MVTNNYYKSLKLCNFSSEEQIREAYKNLIKMNHPDKGGNSTDFIEIKNAYEFLSNKENKDNLDLKLELEEQILEKSEEIKDYIFDINKNSLFFTCIQCMSKNKQEFIFEEDLKSLINKKKENSESSVSFLSILVECFNCSLNFKIQDINLDNIK